MGEAMSNGVGDTEQEGLDGLIDELTQGGAAYKISIYRRWPKKLGGKQIGGLLDTVEGEFPTLEEIRDLYGGGKYQFKIQKQNDNGQWRMYKHYTVEIAGPPKILDDDDSDDNKPHLQPVKEDSSVAREAMRITNQQLESANKRAAESSRFDPSIIQALVEPLRAQISAAQAESSELRKMLMNNIQNPSDSPFRSMAEKMYDGESQRSMTMRQIHESEIRQLRENHNDEIRRIREAHADDVKFRERNQQQVIESIKESKRTEIESIRNSFESRIEIQKIEIARLQGELSDIKTKLSTLEAKKDRSPVEVAQELKTLTENLSSLGLTGGGDDEKEQKWYEKAMDVIANSEIAAKMLGVDTSPPHQQGQPNQPQLPPVNKPFRNAADGNVYIRRPDGTITRIPDPEAPPAATPATTGPKAPNTGEVRVAVQFMENAIQNGTEPETFARTAKSLIPPDILSYIKGVGIDEFLDNVELEPQSPLRTQAGRGFARAAAAAILS